MRRISMFALAFVMLVVLITILFAIIFVIINIQLPIEPLFSATSTPPTVTSSPVHVTPTLTPTYRATLFTRVATQTTTPTKTPKATLTPRPSPTPTPSYTPTLTMTPSPSPSVTPSLTPSVTPTATPLHPIYTATPSPTPWWGTTPPNSCIVTSYEPPCMYTVLHNDSYATISNLFYENEYHFALIRHLNRSIDGTYRGLTPGTKIYIPDIESEPWQIQIFAWCYDDNVKPPCLYIVQRFDTYTNISVQFFNTDMYAARIAAANLTVQRLREGEIIVVPAEPTE